MAPCPDDLSELPEDITEVPVNDAIRALLRARAADANAYFLCSRKQKELSEWIKRNERAPSS